MKIKNIEVGEAKGREAFGIDPYVMSLVMRAEMERLKATNKFPQPNYVALKVAEEAGEVIKAVVHYIEGRETWENLEGEVVQTIAMLMRLMLEGDQINGFKALKGSE